MKSVQPALIPKQYIRASLAFFSFLLLTIPVFSVGQNNPATYIKRLSSEIRAASGDSLKIEKLSKLAFYYSDYLDDKHKADSISQQAVDLAESNFRPGILLLAYNRYIECNDALPDDEKALKFANEAVRISKQLNNPVLEWVTCMNLAKVYLARYDYSKALGCSYQALSLADGLMSETRKAESYLIIGRSLEGNNLKIESFRNYLNATAIAEKSNNKTLLKKCYSQLSGFYNNTHIFEKAIAYKLNQLDIITKSLPVDSVEYMWAEYDLQVINLNSNNNNLNPAKASELISWAVRNNCNRLKRYEISLYRTHLIEAEKIGLLHELYTEKYPGEFKSMENENPAAYFRLKAYFCEADHRPDSALYYLNHAETLIHQDPNKILRANFHQRFGQFLVRQGKPREAIVKFTEAFNLAREASYFEYMLSASKQLEALYFGMGDYKNAYVNSSINRQLADSISMLTKNDQLLTLEIDHETRQRELAAEKEHSETDRRHNIQYTAITIITLSMFILLLMLGSLKVPAWIIKMLGFFSFILFFEFIIMIADHKIYAITANEPWKILLIKIGLIAFLLPFHHWIEKKVIHFLIEHKLITIPDFSIRNILYKTIKKKNAEPLPEEAN